jgi:hypothetical protein
MTRSVSLPQVVELVRVAVELVETQVPKLAAPGEETWLRWGAPADGEPEHVLHGAHRTARHHSLDLLAGIHGDRLIAVVGGRHDPLASGRLLLALFDPGPVVLGPGRYPTSRPPDATAVCAWAGRGDRGHGSVRGGGDPAPQAAAAVPTGHTARR